MMEIGLGSNLISAVCRMPQQRYFPRNMACIASRNSPGVLSNLFTCIFPQWCQIILMIMMVIIITTAIIISDF